MGNSAQNFIEIFKGKSVMIFVAHEDDEIGAFGNLIYELSEAKINTYVVFMTNGDYEGIGKIRIREALSALRILGMKASNVIFLGYCDCLNGTDKHIIYNFSDTPTLSHAGKTETYGTKKYPEWCYRQTGSHHTYTRKNLMKDLESVILHFRPDYIFSGDFDWHADHRALSILIEEVIGRILSTEEEYQPYVFKGFVYSTGYYAPSDYCGINLHSTLKPKPNNQFPMDNPFYDWNKRLRIPVDKKAMTKMKHKNILYKAIKKYQSQYIVRFFYSAANSDEVFWPRRTDSVSYKAKVSASSGNAELLKDFKYLDCSNILAEKEEAVDIRCGVWIPNEEDTEKSFTFYLKDKKDINQISLYENPVAGDNIRKGQLTFSNGYRLVIDSIRHDGRESKISFPCQKSIEWIKFSILNSVGKAGLTEFEIYTPQKEEVWFIKICIHNDYVYDYYTETKRVSFTVTAFGRSGNVIDLPPDKCKIQLTTGDHTVNLQDFKFNLAGRNVKLKICMKDSELIQDEINIHLLRPYMNYSMAILHKMDHFFIKIDDLVLRLNRKLKILLYRFAG
jgi:LmbE family N-acetylglucosaminyl deacetylase